MLMLKGRVSEGLSSDDRTKMERTLRRMEKTRRRDDMRIRDLVEAKKQWAENEKKKGLDIINQLEEKKKDLTKEQDSIRLQLLKIEGCILVLSEILVEANKPSLDENTTN